MQSQTIRKLLKPRKKIEKYKNRQIYDRNVRPPTLHETPEAVLLVSQRRNVPSIQGLIRFTAMPFLRSAECTFL